MKPFGRSKRFVTCKSSGYQANHLNPTTRCKIVFKINPLDRAFPTWRIEGSPLLALAKISPSRLPQPTVHQPHWITAFKLKPTRISFFVVVIELVLFFSLIFCQLFMFMYLIYIDSPFHDYFMTFKMCIIDVFIAGVGLRCK